MRGYTVYRVDYVTGKKEAIGCILERREQERERRWRGNLLELLVEARRLFGRGNGEAINIVLDSPKDAREIKAMAISRGIVTITSSSAVGHGGRLRVLGDVPVLVGQRLQEGQTVSPRATCSDRTSRRIPASVQEDPTARSRS